MTGAGKPVADVSAERLRWLVAMARSFAGARTVDDVVGRGAWAFAEALDGALAGVARWERDAGLLRLLVHVDRGADGAASEAPQDSMPQAMPARGFPMLRSNGSPSGAVLHVDDPELDLMHAEFMRRTGRNSVVEVPLVLDGRVWGLIFAARDAGDPPYGADDLEYATALAGQVAAGLSQAGHFERIAALAYVDPLTGVANRRAFDEQLDAAVDAHGADGTPVTLALCDVNDLKQVNDTRGHKAGDSLLLEVAGILSSAGALLPGSLVARIGGDEFCILARGTDPDQVIAAATEVCERAARLEGSSGVSCGVVSTVDTVGPVNTPSRLLRLADAAQYRAKRAGALQPVIAGRRPVEGLAESVPVDELRPDDELPDRRRPPSRTSVEPMGLLAQGLAVLDDVAGRSALVRLEALADAMARWLDGASWWVSVVPRKGGSLHTVGWSVLRDTGIEEPVPEDESFALADFPCSASAVMGGGYAFHTGDGDGDPAEEAFLVARRYSGVLAAGDTVAGTGWLVEVFTDEISAPVDRSLVPVLRALVAAALVHADGTGVPAALAG